MSEDAGKVVKPELAERVTPELKEIVIAAARDGTIACPRLRRIAEQQGVPYRVAGATADLAGIKLRDCDLGCF